MPDCAKDVIPVWYGKHFACQSREKCGKTKGWTPIVLLRYLLEVGILESVTIGEAIISLTKQTKVWLPKNRNISCAIIGKFTQGNKVKEKRLTHRVVIDKGELDFLIQDCIKEGTYAGSDKCPLGYILIYYEVVRIATDSIYIRKEVLYKIENVSAFFKQAKRPSNHKGGVDTSKFQCLHKAPSCAMCEVGVYYSKEAVKKFIEEVIVHYVNRNQVYLSCNEHKPFVCAVCFREWYFRLGEKIHDPDPNVIYWPKDRHWESIKNISESIAPTIYDPITRSRISYLNGGGSSEKITRAIRIFKDINMVVFTHTNALAKDFQNDRKISQGSDGMKKVLDVVVGLL
ncbi:hypothetical protein GLOIN_2v1848952 [Rhizophagus clarus]|uniref:Uncharacterized protein n=1 Tax=Rhizophagus clarus TaxID=94130 RepID=A0A8H3LPQ0_9GLOM|nr:hypothetical protein GLOIN_2v1848952 [Rhizophagus clarus]